MVRGINWICQLCLIIRKTCCEFSCISCRRDRLWNVDSLQNAHNTVEYTLKYLKCLIWWDFSLGNFQEYLKDSFNSPSQLQFTISIVILPWDLMNFSRYYPIRLPSQRYKGQKLWPKMDFIPLNQLSWYVGKFLRI